MNGPSDRLGVMITDPLVYLAAIPAVAITGLSKGGFGGAFGFAAVPILALVMPPVAAAGVMLPLLVMSDAVAVWSYRRSFDRRLVGHLLAPGLAGTALGWATARYVSDDAIRLVVGLIAIIFLLRLGAAWWLRRRAAGASVPARPSTTGGWLWGTATGYTSFIAHAGGPPFQAYVMPLGLPPQLYAGTSAIYFALLNAIKLVPYAALGQFGGETLQLTLVMAPVAILSTIVGVRLVSDINPRLFYAVLTLSVAIVGVELVREGVAHLLSG